MYSKYSMRCLRKVAVVFLLLPTFLQAQEVPEESRTLSSHYFEVFAGYILSSKFNSTYSGSAIVQNATDAINLSLRYRRQIYKNFDLGLGVSLDSSRTFIGREVNGVAFAYLNPVPNLMVSYAELFTFYNIGDFYVMGASGTGFPQDANFPAGFKSAIIMEGGVGWRASDSFTFEVDYRAVSLASSYYDSFSQNSFLIRVGYSFR